MAEIDKGFLFRNLAETIKKELPKAIMYLERKGIPVYVKLSGDGEIVAITVDPVEAKKPGYIRYTRKC